MANYDNLIAFIKRKEGGLSDDPNDINPAKNPSPCGNGKNGKPYHTNKGVTYNVFKTYANKLGYDPNCDNFIKMPADIWKKIYKGVFWTPMGSDIINNQAIANTFVEFAWGSGLDGATKALKKFFKETYNKDFSNTTEMANFCNDLDAKGLTPELFDKLNTFRKNFFISLNRPKYTQGWINRLNAFYILNKPYALTSTQKNYLAAGVLSIIAGVTLYYYYGRSNTK